MPEPRAAGTIYDLGYQRYTGQRLGRGHGFRQLLTYSFKAAYGAGRGQRARLVPFVVLLVVFVPAIGQLVAASFTGQTSFINYSQYLDFTAFLVALFAAAQAPELIVTDRQYGVLSLYLSRPLRGTDYALAKITALVLAMLVLTAGPQLFLFFGKVFISATPFTVLKTEWRKLFPIIGGTLGTSVYMATIALALSSRASRRAFGNAAVIAYFLFMPAAAAIFYSIARGNAKRYSVLAHPVWLLTGFTDWMFNIEARRRSVIGRVDLPGEAYLYTILAMSLVATAVVLQRYRKAES